MPAIMVEGWLVGWQRSALPKNFISDIILRCRTQRYGFLWKKDIFNESGLNGKIDFIFYVISL
jgi:hypothetical protein